jgi:ABC-type branched-subunit amino acid transport system ATPase component
MILEVKDIYTSYGLSQVLFGVSLTVEEGEVISLLGRNGVGKTTRVRSIMGLTPAGSGSIALAGVDITATPTYLITRMGVGLVPQGRVVYEGLPDELAGDDRTKEEQLGIGGEQGPDFGTGFDGMLPNPMPGRSET